MIVGAQGSCRFFSIFRTRRKPVAQIRWLTWPGATFLPWWSLLWFWRWFWTSSWFAWTEMRLISKMYSASTVRTKERMIVFQERLYKHNPVMSDELGLFLSSWFDISIISITSITSEFVSANLGISEWIMGLRGSYCRLHRVLYIEPVKSADTSHSTGLNPFLYSAEPPGDCSDGIMAKRYWDRDLKVASSTTNVSLLGPFNPGLMHLLTMLSDYLTRSAGSHDTWPPWSCSLHLYQVRWSGFDVSRTSEWRQIT